MVASIFQTSLIIRVIHKHIFHYSDNTIRFNGGHLFVARYNYTARHNQQIAHLDDFIRINQANIFHMNS